MNGEQSTAAVIEALEQLEIPYMLVGSFSSNVYGVIRATQDADIVVELGGKTLTELQQRLGSKFQVGLQLSFETATGTRRNVITISGSPFSIELFRLSNDLHDQERFRRRRRQACQQLGRDVMLPTVEDVVLFKLRWAVEAGRAKDRDDVRDVIAVQEGKLDWNYVHHWAGIHATRAALDEIVASIPPEIIASGTQGN